MIPIPGVGTAIGMFLGGTGGSALGGVIYDAIFKNKKPEPSAESVDNFYSEFQEGGEVERPRRKSNVVLILRRKEQIENLRVPKPTKERSNYHSHPEVLMTEKRKKMIKHGGISLGWAGTGSPENKRNLELVVKNLLKRLLMLVIS